jgi:hypothetical protein
MLMCQAYLSHQAWTHAQEKELPPEVPTVDTDRYLRPGKHMHRRSGRRRCAHPGKLPARGTGSRENAKHGHAVQSPNRLGRGLGWARAGAFTNCFLRRCKLRRTWFRATIEGSGQPLFQSAWASGIQTRRKAARSR